ncbi:hypothetical protein FHG87_020363 [Trinorchestia longiramus]|nr:hypothetical protein FHG87_020363 [Trinorchestia longiramus]
MTSACVVLCSDRTSVCVVLCSDMTSVCVALCSDMTSACVALCSDMTSVCVVLCSDLTSACVALCSMDCCVFITWNVAVATWKQASGHTCRVSRAVLNLRHISKSSSASQCDVLSSTALLLMPAGSMTAGSMTAGSMTAGSMTAGSMTAGSMTAGSMTAGSMTAGSMTAGSMTAGSMTAGSMTAGSMTAGSMTAVYIDQPSVSIMASVSGSNGSTFTKDTQASKISLSQRIAMTGIPRTSTGVSLIVKNSSRLVPNKRTFSCSESKLLSTTGSFLSNSLSNSICDVSSVNKVIGAKTYSKINLIKQASEAAPPLISASWMHPICSSSISNSLSDNKFDASNIKVKKGNLGRLSVSNADTDTEIRDLSLTPRLAVAMIPRDKPRPHQAANAVVFSPDVGISATNLSQVCQSQLMRTGSVGAGQLIKTGSVNNGHLIRTSINGGQKPLILATLPAISASRSANSKHLFHSFASSEGIGASETHGATTSASIEGANVNTRVTVVGPALETDKTGPDGSTVEAADRTIVTTAVCGSGATAIVDTSAGTATLVEGAEVVRSSVVSYATPIMHQVFLQSGAPANTSFSTQLVSSSSLPAMLEDPTYLLASGSHLPAGIGIPLTCWHQDPTYLLASGSHLPAGIRIPLTC